MGKACRSCGREWTDKRSPGFREECPGCGETLHSCANCRFYAAGASQWCREPQARDSRPRDAESGNTCEYFLLADSADRDGNAARERQAKAGLAALFGETPTPPSDPDDRPNWMKPG